MSRQYTDNDNNFMRNYLKPILVQKIGLNPKKCAECNIKMKRDGYIHHTKYEKATIYDLVFVCPRCNAQPHNLGLI